MFPEPHPLSRRRLLGDLLHRDSRRVRLTDQGEVLLGYTDRFHRQEYGEGLAGLVAPVGLVQFFVEDLPPGSTASLSEGHRSATTNPTYSDGAGTAAGPESSAMAMVPSTVAT